MPSTYPGLLLFLDNLNGISSTIKSDHILNLFQDVEGCLPDDPELLEHAQRARAAYSVTQENVEASAAQMMTRFI